MNSFFFFFSISFSICHFVMRINKKPQQVLVNVLDSLLKITNASVAVARALSQPVSFSYKLHYFSQSDICFENVPFVTTVAQSLKNPNLYVREKLLRVLINLFDKHEDSWAFISQPHIWVPLEKMASSDPAVVVRNLAKLLISQAEEKRDAAADAAFDGL
jgi:hypothetical protein